MVRRIEPGLHRVRTFPIFAEPEPPQGGTGLTHTGGSGQNGVVQGSNRFRTGSALNPGITSLDAWKMVVQNLDHLHRGLVELKHSTGQMNLTAGGTSQTTG